MIFTCGHACRSRATSSEDRGSVPRRVDIARAQIADQQLLAAKNIKRPEAPVTVVAVKKATFLQTVDAIIGGVEIEHQFGRRLGK